MSFRYSIRPGAAADLDEHASYLSVHATPDAGHRFLSAAHDTFSLLSEQPDMGWHLRWRRPVFRRALRVFRVRGFERMLILYQKLDAGIEILRVIHGSRNLRAALGRDRA